MVEKMARSGYRPGWGGVFGRGNMFSIQTKAFEDVKSVTARRDWT